MQDGNSTDIHDVDGEGIETTWKWFEYHADQRLHAFYYFLLIIGALGYGYVYCLTQITTNLSVYGFAPSIALLAAVISVAFLFIEIRNLNLVNIGRDELVRLKFPASIINKDKYDGSICERLSSHSVWLRFIYLVVFFVAVDRYLVCRLPFYPPGREIYLYLILPFYLVTIIIFPLKLRRNDIIKWVFWAIGLMLISVKSFF
jgi:hypothetical protein